MARIRTIKPEFWADEKLSECSLQARLLFIGLISFADDEGRAEHSLPRMRMQVFPCGSVSMKQLTEWLGELTERSLIRIYSVDSREYLDIPNFVKHQRINRPTRSKFPEPSLIAHGGLTEPSRSTHAGMEGNGRDPDRKGVEGKGTEGARSIPDDPLGFGRVQAAYPKRGGRTNWIQAAHHLSLRIREDGETWDTLIAAATRYCAYCDAVGQTGTQYVLTPERFFSAEDRPWLQPWDPPAAERKPNGQPPKRTTPPTEEEVREARRKAAADNEANRERIQRSVTALTAARKVDS